MKRYPLLGILLLSKIAFAANDVSFLTATSTDGQVVLEFMNPPLGGYDRTRVIGRNDRFANSFDDIDFGQPLFVEDVFGVPGKRSLVIHSGLPNGQRRFYGVFVFDGESWSLGAFLSTEAVDTVNTPIRWKFVTNAGATTMSPPGIGSVILVLSNDKTLYPLRRGPEGGIWALRSLPFRLSDVAQHRPAVVPPTGIFDGHSVTFVTTQDGFLNCFNADTGEFLWQSADYGMLTGASGGWFSTFSAPEDRVYLGTRNAGEPNAIVALDIADGTEVWRFDDPGGTRIGIIPGGPTIDYANRAAYFASEEYTAGADTVWAVDLLTGEKIWSTPVGSISGSPVQRGLDLYVGNVAGRVHALDVRDGKPKGNFPFDTGGGTIKGYVFPNLVGNELYLSTQNTVWRIHDDGSRVVLDWAAEVSGASIPTYPPGREFLWVGSDDGNLYQLDAKSGAKNFVTLTSGRTPGVGSPSFDLANGLIYVGTENGEVLAVQVPF